MNPPTINFLTERLKNYLESEVTKVKKNDQTQSIFNHIGKNYRTGKMKKYDRVVILNFNYTPTIQPYILNPENNEIIHIHGELNNPNNPIIFGVGDENHSLYKELEESNITDFLVNVKSLKYLETSNYTNLRHALDNYDIDVHMIGHSGGISDRTLLKEVFEHENCKEINIHHHPSEYDPDGKQAYRNISYGVSRYFKNNIEMRRKVKPYDETLTIPQYQQPEIEG